LIVPQIKQLGAAIVANIADLEDDVRLCNKQTLPWRR
jgi:hypothetical protein